MVSLICKSCGASIPVDNKASSVMCPYCGNLYDVPMDEKREQYLNLYSRADDAWDHKDFEEAADLYQQILNIDNTQADAHFGIVLCKYGVTYEVDPVTKNKMPNCNRINRDSILADKNYLNALKYATRDACAVFERQAKEIDRISAEFLKIVDKEAPYDVFISYKRTGEDGSVTMDSKVARKLYYHLRDKGFKVFFAEETLKSMAGEKYEPYIFAALSSAPVMVLVGTKRDHFEATWVKNEWRRFIALMNQGYKKTLIPAYYEMDPYHMPGELRSLQAMNANDFTFHEDITEIIRKKVADARKYNGMKEVSGISLEEKYASKEKVDKLVELTDCDREFAVSVLVQCHGDLKQSQQYIQEDPDYCKKLWHCAECGKANTHDRCRGCGITKKESVNVARARKEMEERRRKNSEAYKKEKAEKIKLIAKPLIVVVAFVVLIAFVIWPKLIYPNMNNKELYTPEIVQAYSGTYSTGRTNGTAIITITSCDQSGNVQGFFEFMADANYGKYEITGSITEKKNNGNLELIINAGEWVIKPESFTPLDIMEVKISDNYQSLHCSKYSISWSAGENEEYNIKTADDLKKLSGSSGTYYLKNDIDLSGADWTPIEGFTGMLLGNGHTIKGLTIDTSADNVGFFSILSGVVNDLKFENVSIKVSGRQENVGVLCGTLSKGNIMNVSTSGMIDAPDSVNVGGIIGCIHTGTSAEMVGLSNTANVTGESYVGGIIGRYIVETNYNMATTQLDGFVNSGMITGTGDYVGGIIGSFDGNQSNYRILYVSDFDNTGDVKGAVYVGGIFGYAYAGEDSYIRASNNRSSIEAEAYVGCIAGSSVGVTINDCKNGGSTLTATKFVSDDGVKYAYVGGFAGEGSAANNCTNEVDIQYTAGGACVGGVIGGIHTGVTRAMEGLSNTANITGASHVGGIIGRYIVETNYNMATTQLDGFVNSGTITGTGDYVGGIIGSFDGNQSNYRILYVSDFDNTGDVKGAVYVGGIFGYAFAGEDSYIRDSNNQSAIEAEAYVGCIAGSAVGIEISDCANSGSTLTATKFVSVDGVKYAYVGGFAGEGSGANNCTNEVDIQYTAGGACVGGVIGGIHTGVTRAMEGLSNVANISGASHVGGIIGRYIVETNYNIATTQLDGFVNSGTITGTGDYVGGIIGSFDGNQSNYRILYVSDFNNTGNVNGAAFVGGIFGYASAGENSYIMDSSTASGKIAGSLNGVTVR